MVKLIEEKLGQIPETETIEQLLQDAFDPSNQRNHLAHGIWWAFDPQTASIHVRGGIQRKNKDQFGEYCEETILAIADRFETLEDRETARMTARDVYCGFETCCHMSHSSKIPKAGPLSVCPSANVSETDKSTSSLETWPHRVTLN